MIRLESGGSDYPMGMSFWRKGVNTSSILHDAWVVPVIRAP